MFIQRRRRFSQSAAHTVSGGGGGDSAAYTNFVARTSGGNLGGDTTAQTNYKNLLNGLTTDGIFASDGTTTKLDCLYILSSIDETTAKLNLVGTGSTYNLTKVSTPTFTANQGFSGFSATKYLDTGFVPNTAGGNFAVNAASNGCYITGTSSTQDSNCAFGCEDGSGSASNAVFPNFTGGAGNRVRNNNISLTLAVSHRSGFAGGSQNSASNPRYYAVKYDADNPSGLSSTSNTAPGTLAQYSFWIGGLNRTGTMISPTTIDQISMMFIGGAMTSTNLANLASRVNTFMTALSINVY